MEAKSLTGIGLPGPGVVAALVQGVETDSSAEVE